MSTANDYRIRKADFILGGYNLKDLPSTGKSEIAFLGRSNAGKSSLVNRLTNRKSLARVSRTPGRTQQINLFEVDLLTPAGESIEFNLADLPGYGYGRFSKGRRQSLSSLIVSYLETRAELALVCLLQDSKRQPEGDELAVRDLCFENGISLLVVATKCDRLSKKDLQKQTKSISESYRLLPEDLLISGQGVSIAKFWDRVVPLL